MYWSGRPCPPPGSLPDPGIKPMFLATPTLAGRFSTTGPRLSQSKIPCFQCWHLIPVCVGTERAPRGWAAYPPCDPIWVSGPTPLQRPHQPWGLQQRSWLEAFPRLPGAPPAGPAALTKHRDPCGLNSRSVLSQSRFLLAGRGPPSVASAPGRPSVQGPRVSRVASAPTQDTGCGSGPTHNLL